MNKIPSVLSFEIFNTIGYYDYIYTKECTLKGMRSNIVYKNELPSEPLSKSIIIGRFYHRSIENLQRFTNLYELQKAIEDDIKSIQKEVSQFPHLKKHGSVSGWSEINKVATFVLQEFKRKSPRLKDATEYIEVKLFSKDNILLGKPDSFIVKNGKAILKEFKSSSIRNEFKEIRKEYIEQLLFYSVLLFDNFDILQVNAAIESLDKDGFETTILKPESEEMRTKVLKTIKEANEKILSASSIYDLATPSLTSCASCHKKIVCDRFKENQRSLGVANNINIVDGRLLSINNGPNKIQSDISVQDKFSNIILIVRLPTIRANTLLINSFYVFDNLVLQNDVYIWSDKSRCFTND